jgi:hypothetical protein
VHAIHNQVLKTEKCINVAESKVYDQNLNYYLDSIINNTCAAGSVAV